MEKSKKRTDLLAAGRERLQQFRQKKDHKGGKSSRKTGSKPEKVADAEEPATLVDAYEDPAVAMPSVRGVEKDARSLEELPVELNHREDDHHGSEQNNGEMEDQKQEAERNATDFALDSDGLTEGPIVVAMTHSLAAESHGGKEGHANFGKSLEVVEDSVAAPSSSHEVADRLLSLSEESHGGEVGTASSGKSLEALEDSVAAPGLGYEVSVDSVVAPGSGYEVSEVMQSLSTRDGCREEEGINSSSKSMGVEEDLVAASHSQHEVGQLVDGVTATAEEIHAREEGATCSSPNSEVVEDHHAASSLVCEAAEAIERLPPSTEETRGEEGTATSSKSLEVGEDSFAGSSLKHVAQEVDGLSTLTEEIHGSDNNPASSNMSLEVAENSLTAPSSKHEVGQVVEASSALAEENYGCGDGCARPSKGLEAREGSVANPTSKHDMGIEVDGFSGSDKKSHMEDEGFSNTSESLEIKEDSVAIPNMGHKVALEVDGFYASAEESGWRTEGLTAFSEGLEIGVSETVNGGDKGHLVLEDHGMNSLGGVKEGITDIAGPGLGRDQQVKGMIMLAEAAGRAVMKPFDEHNKNTSYLENQEKLSSSDNIYASKTKDGDANRKAEGEGKVSDRSSQLPFLIEDVTIGKVTVEKLGEEKSLVLGKKIYGVMEEDSLLLSNSAALAAEHKGPPQGSFADELESIKRHIYLSCIVNDFLQLQLDEQTDMDAEFYRHSSDEVSTLWNSVKETQASKNVISEELVQCRGKLQAMVIEKEELEIRCLSAKEEVDRLNLRASELQNKLALAQEESEYLSAELANCKFSLEAQQLENLNATASLTSEIDARKKLEEEREFLYHENMKFASELSKQKGRLLADIDEQMQFEARLRELEASVEQLSKENLYLSTTLHIHRARLQELEDKQPEFCLEAVEAGNQVTSFHAELIGSDDVPSSAVVSHAQDLSPAKVDKEDAGDFTLLKVLKEHLEGAENILQSLENSIQGMHSHTLSLSRSGGRRAGVSKLIQAFESKVHVGDNVPDEFSLTEGEKSEDSYALMKKHTSSLRAMLKQVVLDVDKAEVLLVEAQNSRKLCREFEVVCLIERQRNDSLLVKFNEFVKNVSEYESRIENQQKTLDEIQQNISSEVKKHLGIVELLQMEMNETASTYKQQRESMEVVIIKAVEKLDLSTGLLISKDLDLVSHVGTSVNAAAKKIESLHEKLETAHLTHHAVQSSYEELNKLFRDLQGKYDLACRLLDKNYRDLSKLVSHSSQDTGCAVMDMEAGKVQQFMTEAYEMHFGQLQKLLDERLNLLLTNNEIGLELLNKNQDIEDLKNRCMTLDRMLEDISGTKDGLESTLMKQCSDIEEVNKRCLSLAKRLEDHEFDKDSIVMGLSENNEHTLKPDSVESAFYSHVLSHLEAIVVSHIKKYEEAINQIQLSKTYLQELNTSSEVSADYWCLPLTTLLREDIVPKVKELTDLQEKVCLLSASNIQQEYEMKILKERLNEMEEAMELARSELQLKVSELEQSEQRLSSVREKLSIAVAKGKGLIVQRDGLKQSLMEKLCELEKCQHELLSKEALLHEVEAKLKSCSEVGRIEALESELSYIRNSATAMRDSFLLKDSILQRIEEVLEDLDLPEHFHSRDIVEKIELLSKMAAGNSFPATDWDQKSSMAGSQSDTGFVPMDAWKDDIQPTSDRAFDDLKRKYEELHRKFYGLAEHNDMLEQSLVERNNLIQKWEEILDGIDVPSQLRVLEPEDKLEWLGRALSEVQRQKDSLQHKIENLESSSDLLIVDLEESRNKISELGAEIVATKSEREFFAQSLDKLRFEYCILSEKAVQDELDRDNLQRELADMQGRLVKIKDHRDVEAEMQKLHDMVNNALPDCDKSESLSADSGCGFECLEGLVKKLVDRYAMVSALSSGEKTMQSVAEREVVIEEINLSPDGKTLNNITDDKEQDIEALWSELDEAVRNQIIVKEERDATMERCHSLMLEVDAITKQRNLLQEERMAEMEKYQHLVFELEEMRKEKDTLREQLAQEEQKSASTREKLNVAVRKGKGLVQQRDRLKQTIEEMNAMVDHMKSEHNQHLGALKSEKMLLVNRLTEIEMSLHDSDQTLNTLLTALNAINVSGEVNIIDPMQKIEEIRKFICDLQSAVTSSEHEAKKSKRSAELLLAELNEVQERADLLQEELGKAEIRVLECSKQRDVAEASRIDAFSCLQHAMIVHSEERRKHIDGLVDLRSTIEQIRGGCSGFSSLLDIVFNKNVELFCYVEAFLDSVLKHMDGENVPALPVLASRGLLSNDPINEEKFSTSSEHKIQEDFDGSLIDEHLALAGCSLNEYMKDYDNLKGLVHKHSYALDQQATCLLNIMGTIEGKIVSSKELFESLKRDISGLEAVIKEKETEICSMWRCVSLLYGTCSSLIAEIKSRKFQVVEDDFSPGNCAVQVGSALNLPSNIGEQDSADQCSSLFVEENIRTVTDTLVSIVRESGKVDKKVEDNQRELKATISDLQRELQEKDIQMNRISGNLVSQIKEAESVAKRYSIDLDSAKSHICSLEKQFEVLESDKKMLELRVDELQGWEASSKQFQDKIKSSAEALAAKDQEIEALMQALDEEESQMDALENRIKELEDIVQEKNLAMESLEASRAKAVAKLSTTVNKFDELHDLSESLLAEVESLQAQLQNRDSEISCLRHEVTRCTNDVLIAQEAHKKYSSMLHELLKRMDGMTTRLGEHQVHLDDEVCGQIHAYADFLDKNLESVMSELDDLRLTAQSKDALLQNERSRVEELLHNVEALKNSLHEKETHIQLFQDGRDSGQPDCMNSPAQLEMEQWRKKVASPTIAPHVRGGRKIGNDQIAIAIDSEMNDSVLKDEDDDKAHGFKSLTMSRIIPRATRPIADRIDAIWVSGDRWLMRQPTLRLGILIYWVALHALLASLI